MKTLFVIDAAGYIYRSYFAIRNMTNDQGESTNALFGFVRFFIKLFKDFHPTHCIAVFDGETTAVIDRSSIPITKLIEPVFHPIFCIRLAGPRNFARYMEFLCWMWKGWRPMIR